MFRVIILYEDSPGNAMELTGLSKRVNTIGLQPIPGDQFEYENLTRDDKTKISPRVAACAKLVVKSREFNFENPYAVLRIRIALMDD